MKKILIISYYFAPENKVAAIRYTKIAKYLKRMGYNITVLCAPIQGKVDPILERDMSELTSVNRVMCTKWYAKINDRYMKKRGRIISIWQEDGLNRKFVAKLKQKTYLGIRSLYSFFMGVLLNYSAYYNTKKYLNKINDKYDVVISTYGPRCNHMLGSWLKRKCKVKWISDFRDPIMNRGVAKIQKIGLKRLELSYCEKSDYIIGVANGVISDKCMSLFKDKYIIITNGFDVEDIGSISVEKKNSLKISMVYTGALYKNLWRDLRPIFNAINELDKEGFCNKTDFEINYAGNDIDILYDQARAYNCEGIINNYGFITRDASIRLQLNSDVLLHATWYTNKNEDVISGKIFEYMLMHKPIISTVVGSYSNSKIKEMIKTANVGFCYEEAEIGDFDNLKKYLRNIYIEKLKTGIIKCNAKENVVSEFNYKNIAKTVSNIIEKL